MTKYLITEFDFNDVFSKTELEFKDYNEAVKYVYDQFREDLRDQIDEIGGDPESFCLYYPVVDEEGNEVKPEDPRYEELNETQELRVSLGYTIEEIE